MDDETTEERDTAERDDLTENEARRAGEFDDLRDMLRSVLDRVSAISERIDGIYDNFSDAVAQMVENGAIVKETDDDAAEAIAQAAAEDLENLDYTM
jgi:ABC-type transporter Mla subunit MlaD